MARRSFIGMLAGGAALLLGACSFRPSFRYKMTVELDTPEGVKSGYSVREVSFRARANGGDYGHVRGEAVAVDLPGGKTLFALLTGEGGNVDHAGDEMASLLKQLDRDAVQLWPDPPRVSAPIITDPLPMLVTFTDTADPKSVERVDPDDLTASFGPGHALKRITVEKTNENVTVGIENRLGWLPQVYTVLKNQKFKPQGIPLGDFKGLFSKGLNI